MGKKLLLALTSLALVLTACEAVTRIIGFDPDLADHMRFHALLGWTMDPGSITMTTWLRCTHFSYPAPNE